MRPLNRSAGAEHRVTAVFAHRGLHTEVPENTHQAFALAVTAGVDGIETDVRLTADNLAILFHDRCVGGQPVASLTHKQLCLAAGYPVPTLESALEQWRDVAWNIEIKDPQAGETAAAIIRRYAAGRQMLVTSFWHNVALDMHRQCGVPWGALVAHRSLSGRGLFADLCSADAAPQTVVWSYDAADLPLLAEAQAHGLQNFVYGPQSPEEHQRLLAWPVDGVITDFPRLLRCPAAA